MGNEAARQRSRVHPRVKFTLTLPHPDPLHPVERGLLLRERIWTKPCGGL